MKIEKIIIVFGIGMILSSCGHKIENNDVKKEIQKNDTAIILVQKKYDSEPPPIDPPKWIHSTEDTEVQKENLISLAKKICSYLKVKDLENLSEVVIDEGLFFSPYGQDNKKGLIFDKKKITLLKSDSTVYNWGNYDGSGDPIRLTFNGYYKRFIFDKDYTKIDSMVLDFPEFHVTSMTRNATISFCFGGTKKNEFMDWSSLTLFFKEKNAKWYLAGIIHNQWTI